MPFEDHTTPLNVKVSTYDEQLSAKVNPGAYNSQLTKFAITGVLATTAAIVGIDVFLHNPLIASDSKTISNGRGYNFGGLLGMILWTFCSPLALAAGLATLFTIHKNPNASKSFQLATAIATVFFAIISVILSLDWLEAEYMMSCGYIWCYTVDYDDSNSFSESAGSVVFFVTLMLLWIGLVLVWRTFSRSENAFRRDTPTLWMEARSAYLWRRRLAAGGLLVGLPMMLLLTGILPGSFEGFTASSIAKYEATSVSPEFANAWMSTTNWVWSDDLIIKIFPDCVIFYVYLEIIIGVSFLMTECSLVRSILSRQIWRYSVSQVLLSVWSVVCLILFVWYWAHDHNFHGDDKYNIYPIETVARVFGLCAVMMMGLTLIVAGKSSPFHSACGLSWESVLWIHIMLGFSVSVTASCHALTYFIRFTELGYPADILPFNAWFWYPQDPVGGSTPSDNWTVPLMITVFWPSIPIYGAFPYMRRRSHELFRYTHNMGLVLVPAALWHATHSWNYLLPGIVVWLVDYARRYLGAAEIVQVKQLRPTSFESWTKAVPGCSKEAISEKITKVAFTWPGEASMHSPGMYVIVNFPQVSVHEWHPFSLSSSPLDSESSVHVKSMGPGSFTDKLYALAKTIRESDLVMNVEGPYGPCLDFDTFQSVLLVAGGIGVTPMVSTMRYLVQLARLRKAGALRHLHLVWIARSSAGFDMMQNELDLMGIAPSLEIKISLYCSTLQHEEFCLLGTVHPGLPDFREILSEETVNGSCYFRASGPEPMIKSCAKAASLFEFAVNFEPWSFVL